VFRTIVGPYRWALLVFLVILAATWWRPIWPAEQALHHSLTVVAVIALLLVHRRHPLPIGSFVLILVFLTLHTIAARWIYSFVPYQQWLQAFGIRPAGGRNQFDRLVHFSYGICFGTVIFRYLADSRGWRPRWAAFAAVDIILSTSALYELFEWAIAMTLAPGAAEAYNGQQGDMWDSHKDMGVAALGALLAVTLIGAIRRAYREAAVDAAHRQMVRAP
jgi:putative membrane protein